MFFLFCFKILNRLEVGELFLELPNGKSYKFGRSQSKESIKPILESMNGMCFLT